jgi:hypothetical protein
LPWLAAVTVSAGSRPAITSKIATAAGSRAVRIRLCSSRPAASAAQQTTLLVEMLRQNTQLTETVKAIAERLESLTLEVHKTVVNSRTP